MGIEVVDDIAWMDGLQKLERMITPPVKGNVAIIHGYIDRLVQTIPGNGPEICRYFLGDVIHAAGFKAAPHQREFLYTNPKMPEGLRSA